MIGRRIGRFQVVAEIGTGGMATVWKATDPLLARDVALKILSPECYAAPKARRRFLDEARTAARLHHPGIVAIYDAGIDGEHAYIAMALIDGITLSDLAQRGPRPIAEIARLGAGAARALAHAHALGVIHRDVTGRNIMSTQDQRVCVLDFGLALADGNPRLTTTGATIGTISYLSPEAARGREPDPRTDVYGLGVVLYELATGTLPFTGAAPAVLEALIRDAPEPPRMRRPDLDPRLERAILRALEKEPAARHGSMLELATELEEIGALRPVRSAPTPRVEDVPGRSERTPSAWEPPDHPAIVVLPFEDRNVDSAEPPATRLGPGFAEAVGARLAECEALRIVPAFVVAASDARLDDPAAIARRFASNLVLRGGLRRCGQTLRVSYTVLDPYRGIQALAGALDGISDDLFEFEDKVAAAILDRLGLGPAAPRQRRPDPVARERYLQALGYLQRSDNEATIDGAIAILEDLDRTSTPRSEVLATLGRAYLRKYRMTSHRQWEAKAAQACERALQLERDAPIVRATLGEIHVATGRYDQAIAEFRSVLESDPTNAEASIGLSRALEAKGDSRAAEACLQALIEREPSDARAHARLGMLRFNRGDFTGAVEAWRDEATSAPDSPRSHFNLACAYFHLDRFEEAVEECRRSLALRPTPSCFSTLGTILFYLGRFEESFESLAKAAQLQPADPVRWGDLGSAYRWTPGHRAEAIEPLRKAIDMVEERLRRNPNAAMDWCFLACWRSNLDQHEEAIAALERALGLDATNVRIQALAGMIYHHAGAREKALEWLEIAVERGYSRSRLVLEPSLASLRTDDAFWRIVGRGDPERDSPKPRRPHHGKQEGEEEAEARSQEDGSKKIAPAEPPSHHESPGGLGEAHDRPDQGRHRLSEGVEAEAKQLDGLGQSRRHRSGDAVSHGPMAVHGNGREHPGGEPIDFGLGQHPREREQEGSPVRHRRSEQPGPLDPTGT